MSDLKRGMAFIDFDNINITARQQHNIQYIDFNGLRTVLLKDIRCVGCTVYLPYAMNNLLRTIQKSGLEVQVVSPRKSIDGRLIFDLLVNTHEDNFDVAVIASGDKDYIPVIQEVKRQGKEVKIASFSSSLAHGLTSVADEIINLDKYIPEITPKMFSYKCSKCGKDLSLPFKLYSDQIPLCKDCRKQS